MEETFERRFGQYASQMFQQQCILAANGYSSWRPPTGQNSIDWTEEGHEYITHLYENYEHDYDSRESFLKGLLLFNIIIPSSFLFNSLSDKQRETFQEYYVNNIDDGCLPPEYFGDSEYIATLFLMQSLWLGLDYDPLDYVLFARNQLSQP